MNTQKQIIIALWTFMGIGLVFAGVMLVEALSSSAVVPNAALSGAVSNTVTLSSGTTEQGDVSIDLTPQGVSGGQLVFGLALNTHSVDLSQLDLRQAAVLEYNGKRVNAIAGPQLGGHHINGQLIFPVDDVPNKFTVRISGIPRQQERTYSW